MASGGSLGTTGGALGHPTGGSLPTNTGGLAGGASGGNAAGGAPPDGGAPPVVGGGASGAASGRGGDGALGGAGSAMGGAPEAGGGGAAGNGGTSGAGLGQGGSCEVVHHLELPAFSTSTSSPLAVRSGAEFAVTEGFLLESAAWSGSLSRAQLARDQSCLNSSCAAFFGWTPLRATSGWSLIAVEREQGVGARAWRPGAAGLPPLTHWFDAAFYGQVSVYGVQASRDAARAIFAFGNRVIAHELTVAVFDAMGELVSPPVQMEVSYDSWDCLALAPTAEGAAISVVAESADRAERLWILRELDALGRTTLESRASLPAGLRCPYRSFGSTGGGALAEGPDGYYLNLLDDADVARVGTLSRSRPNELSVDEQRVRPGAVVGAFSERLVFQKVLPDVHAATSFLALPKTGAAAPETLLTLTGFDSLQLISIDGESLFYGVQKGELYVIEEAACPVARP